MLISHRARFLFVHIQKTAGSSLRHALQEAMPDLQIFLGVHDTALQAIRYLGRGTYRQYFTVAFVRNPWERLVSWYAMIEQSRDRKPAWLKDSNRPEPRLWRYVRENSTSFEEFVRHCTAEIEDYDGRKSFCWNQVDYLSDEEGRRIVNFIGRYENLESDAQRLFEYLGIPGWKLPCVNASTHDHYSTYYTDELADVVRRRYARDVEAFGYEFVRKVQP
jgi:hypothetical protein